MPIHPGTRLGPYEVVAPLGAGGMGEVYRARDARLGRDVAIKVLPDGATASAEVRQRFEREAKTISQLGHPNICALFDVGRENGIDYLVMELLEGETLAARLARGRLPMDEVLRRGAEISSALGAAHARGIVHRDLKPANIMLTRSGTKLLDFGLARVFTPASHESRGSTVAAVPDLTQDGSLLGTVPYMAPEQVQRGPTDARTDIFALGAVLYEMATGARAFGGSSQASVLSAILTHDPPPLSAVAPAAPPPLDRIVRRCLAKDPAARWSSAADLEFQLREIAESAAAVTPAANAGGRASRRRSSWLPWGIAALVSVASAVALWRGHRPAAAGPAANRVRFELPPPPGGSFDYTPDNHYLAISPDGQQIAFLATDVRGQRSVWVRPLAATTARPLAGTAGATTLFWSPDGQSIGFTAADQLQRVTLAGVAPVPVCPLSGRLGVSASWGAAGEILFTSMQGRVIFRVSASGGTPVPAVQADSARGEWRVGWPWYLPDGKRFLYLRLRQDGVGTVMYSAPGESPRELFPAESNIEFTEPDLLLYVQDGTLYGRHFDWRKGGLVGGPFAVVDTTRYFLSTGNGGFATSAGGTLVYQASSDQMELAWVDRSGRETGTIGTPGTYDAVNLAPDGNRLLFSRTLPGIGTYDVWLYDLARGTETRLTPGRNSDFDGVWLPGERSIAYSTVDGGVPTLHRLELDTGRSRRMLESNGFQMASDVSPDGRTLAYTELTPAGDYGAWALSLDGGRPPVRMLPPGIRVPSIRFSADGHFIAFISDESGRPEAYVAPFPGPGERVRLSTGGASGLRWPRHGSEILYLAGDGKLVSVPVTTAPSLRLGAPRTLFTVPAGAPWFDFDVTADGGKFLAIVTRIRADQLPLNVVVHWPQGVGK